MRTFAIITACVFSLSTPTMATAAQPTSTSRPPVGESVWIKPSGYGGWQMLQMWRTGKKLRIYHDDGGYPGDGFHCAWGRLRHTRFVGYQQRVAPDPVKVRYTIRRTGKTLRVLGLTGIKKQDRRPWRKSTVKRFHQLVPPAADNPGTWCRTFSPS